MGVDRFERITKTNTGGFRVEKRFYLKFHNEIALSKL